MKSAGDVHVAENAGNCIVPEEKVIEGVKAADVFVSLHYTATPWSMISESP